MVSPTLVQPHTDTVRRIYGLFAPYAALKRPMVCGVGNRSGYGFSDT